MLSSITSNIHAYDLCGNLNNVRYMRPENLVGRIKIANFISSSIVRSCVIQNFITSTIQIWFSVATTTAPNAIMFIVVEH